MFVLMTYENNCIFLLTILYLVHYSRFEPNYKVRTSKIRR